MDKFDNIVKGWMSVFDNNEYLSAALSIFLIVYASLAAPKLPANIVRLFDNSFFRLLMFFLIAYSAKKNPTVAIIAALGLMVSLQTLSRLKVNTNLLGLLQSDEGYASVSQTTQEYPQMPSHTTMEETVGSHEIELPEREILSELDDSLNQQVMGVPENGVYVSGSPTQGADIQSDEMPMNCGMMKGIMLREPMESQGPITQEDEMNAGAGCTKVSNYRNSFYPQYANMKPDAYEARYINNDVSGFDSSAKYASI